MADKSLTVVVICSNPHHRGLGDGPAFTLDAERGLAVSEPVSIEEAAELVEEVEGYRCPQLDAVEQAEKDADPEEGKVGGSSSKLDGAPMPEGSPGADAQQAAREGDAGGEEAAEEEAAEEDDGADGVPVLAVKGIGDKTLPDLHDAGVETAAQLIERDADELAEKVGHSADVVEKWQAAARELTGKA